MPDNETVTELPVTPEPPKEVAPVPYARFQEVNTKAKELEARLAGIEAKEKEANEKALAEQNKWQELYQNTQKELATEKKNNLRLKVASSKGLPIELVERLRGETEEEITTDAEGLLALLRIEPATTKGLPRIRSNGNAANIDLLTETDPAKIREAYRAGNK